MSNADELVKGWILRSWSDTQHRKKEPTGDERHVWNCGPTVKTVDVSWDCGCYSDYSRDDNENLVAVIGCGCGTEITYDYGYLWDFPRIIREILEKQAPPLGEYCGIERQMEEL